MSPRPSLRDHRQTIVFILLAVSSLVLLAFTSSDARSRQRDGVSAVGVVRAGAHAVVAFFRNTVNSINELSQLRERYQAATTELEGYRTVFRTIEELERENARLRELLDFQPPAEMAWVPAQVIGRDPTGTKSDLVINRGASHGVGVNSVVVGGRNADAPGLVGRVVRVSGNQAFVLPISDPISHVAVRSIESRYEGLISGRGSAPLWLQYVDKRASGAIAVGESIVTSGLGSVYPSGITVGVITEITSDPAALTLSITVEPVARLSQLEYLYVGVPITDVSEADDAP